MNRDFASAWYIDVALAAVPTGTEPPTVSWWLSIPDNSDAAAALGYQDRAPDDLPLGMVFAGTELQFGSQWTVTARHGLLEMLADPDINLAAHVDKSGGGTTLYADFVYPAWFESFRTAGSTQFDQQKRITQPFQMLAAGHIARLANLLGREDFA